MVSRKAVSSSMNHAVILLILNLKIITNASHLMMLFNEM
jgi:hypothetical protein